jgi:hypothetical protein
MSAPLPPPTLTNIRPEDLRDVGRSLALFDQAVIRGLARPSEDGRLAFLALAAHAVAVGQNPGALFASLLRKGLWKYATQADEDAARRKLKPPSPEPLPAGRSLGIGSGRSKDLGLSADAVLVREVRAAVIRAGIFRDPYPTFQARYGWDRRRWDKALGELGLA